MTGANRDVIYTYGNNGELLTVRDYGQGLSVSYAYDAMGREVSRQYGNGGRQDTTYDEAGRTIMVRELSARGEILRAEGYVYDSMGRRSATVDEKGRVTLYRYDGQSRLSAVLYPVSEALVASDEAEAQKSGTRFNGSFTLGERIFLDGDEYSACANRLEAMGYGMSRLLTSAHNQWRQAFTYDANGNRLTKTTSWGTIVYEYDGENRLLGAGTLRYAYDADGNLLSETSPYGTKTYRYSGSNRMKESRVTDLEAKTEVLTSYAYDAFGRRTLVADDGGDTMRTMYDGLSFEVFHEGVAYADSSFASASSRSVPGSAMGSTNGRYVYIDDEADGRSSFVSNDSVRRIAVRYTGESSPLYAGGARVAVNRSGNETTRGGRVYFGTDILGSVRSASGDNSVLEDRYEYDAFGVPYEGDFSSGTGAGYTGKPYDPITGLANYGYRDYSPVTARFTTVDPIRDGSNWFAYVNNDPVNYIDEWGFQSISIPFPQSVPYILPLPPSMFDPILTPNIPIYESSSDQSTQSPEGIDWENPPEPSNPGPEWKPTPGSQNAPDKNKFQYTHERTGARIRWDGDESNGHWHRLNPKSKGPKDAYLDKYGNPVKDRSPFGHIYLKGTIPAIFNNILEWFTRPKTIDYTQCSST